MFLKSLFNKILCFLGFACASQAVGLCVGKLAPDFKLTDDQGNTRTLTECRGKKVALIFYPKDNSYFCTKQVNNIKEHFPALISQHIIVFGISSDSTKKHRAFKEKHNLPFNLLTASQEFLDIYDASGTFFNKRKTILIDEKGIIIKIIDDIEVGKHAQQILDGFASHT